MSNVTASLSKRQSGNVFLVGLMGAGKTTVGKLLAKQLGKDFVDSDEVIQRRTGVTITHIFDVEGETGFRKRESAVIRELVQMNNIVLATGGGAVLSEDNRHELSCNGLVVYLRSSVHDLWYRTRHDKSRPLLQTEDPLSRLKELFNQRDPIYSALADITLSSGKQSAQQLVVKLQHELDLYPSTPVTPCRH